MKYHGIELKEFVSDKPVAFNPPKKMLCWDVERDIELDESYCKNVDTWLPAGTGQPYARAVTINKNQWLHCAEMPEGEK